MSSQPLEDRPRHADIEPGEDAEGDSQADKCRNLTGASPLSGAHEKYEVGPLELFFDLVFVFAVSQLSHHLLPHLTWQGAVETVVMLLAIFAVWFTTSWSATLIPVDQARTRWLVLTVMLLGLFLNAAVTKAFTTSGWAFVIPLLSIQLERAAWMVVNASDVVFREHYYRTLLWIWTAPLKLDKKADGLRV